MGIHGWQRWEVSKDTLLGKFVHALRWLLGIRASPRLLTGVCVVQFVVLLAGVLQQLSRAECAIALPTGGPVVIDCDSCRRVGLTSRAFLLNLIGAGVIGVGLLAVHRRDGALLYYYGSAMIFFSFVIGLTAVLTALETPVLEVAVEGVTQDDGACLEMASAMMYGARDHATLAALGCAVDTAGAVLAIRSRELFNYEEISAQHAAVATAQTL